MRKFRLIARREYLINIRRRGFLLMTFGLPALVVIIVAIAILTYGGGGEPSSLGYVDQSSVLSTEHENPGFRPFADTDSAQTALLAAEIDGYFVLPSDYRETGQLEIFYHHKAPSSGLQERFTDFIHANLVAGFAPAVAERLLEGTDDIVVRSADGGRERRGADFVALLLPFIVGVFLTFSLTASNSYLLHAVADEKESRTVEIMATSVSPAQLLIGKTAGLVGLAFTQIIIWTAAILAGVTVAARFVPSLAEFQVPFGLLGLLAAYFVPLFILAAAIVIIAGISVSNTTQGQQVTGVFTLLFLLPLFFSPLMGFAPDGAFMVALSLFPPTSMLTMAGRWGATVVPLWQSIASWLILASAAGAGLWAVPKVYRYGMLRYGRRLTLGMLLRGVRGQRSAS